MIKDTDARQRALDPVTSFIVQAPAGSGKTSLLVQRFLRLLDTVEAPEEVLAITFTRKAAAEMKGRILEWLERAAGPDASEQQPDYIRVTLALAKKVLIRSEQRDWRLQDNPERLRLMTVDAFNSLLAAQMPIMSRAGAMIPVVDDAEFLYREAARRLPQLLASSHGEYLEVLLKHMDNDVSRLETLLISMLACRDHWLGLVVQQKSVTPSKILMERAFATLVRNELDRVDQSCPKAWFDELDSLLAFQRSQLPAAFTDVVNRRDSDIQEQLRYWSRVAALLLTDKGQPRKRLTKANGFPPKFSKEKSNALSLAAELERHPRFTDSLQRVRDLPDPTYEDGQWHVLVALLNVLPLCAAQLNVVFRENRLMDFIGVSDAALWALGDEEQPTDLAMTLDYRIKHILVDEFQDTSHSQYRLMNRLTAGWMPGDGRSLFCVGDPMQSIYRFRQAEVGLFMNAFDKGLPHLPMEALTLTSNFRSDRGVVDWINSAFEKVLPAENNPDTGAVSYVPSLAENEDGPGDEITLHPFFVPEREPEAERVLEVIRTAKKFYPEDNIAILVSSRSHLQAILPKLKAAGIRFQAVEIDPLSDRQTIRDLLSLTKAVTSFADRTSWLAILRAPWVGLTLTDLLQLFGETSKKTVWGTLLNSELGRLNSGAQSRVKRFISVLQNTLANRGRIDLASLIEQTWIALGGPATLHDPEELVDVNVFFELLRNRSVGGEVPEIDELDGYLEKMYAATDPKADDQIQIMTVHKAKGLEFDTVIVPGLGRVGGGDDRKLLRWIELNQENQQRMLALAPLHAADTKDPMHDYLKRLDTERDFNEQSRLLYVAATRAKKRLHLMGHVTLDSKTNSVRKPDKRSLLFHLWPAVAHRFERPPELPLKQSPAQTEFSFQSIRIRRFADDWHFSDHVDHKGKVTLDQEKPISFYWAGNTARFIGTAVHQFLQQIAIDGAEMWDSKKVRQHRATVAAWLKRMGLATEELDDSVEQVVFGVCQTLEDPRGQWILSSGHTDTHNEYPMTGIFGDGFRSVVLDRTFMDGDGVRWIIDYKTSHHEGSDIDSFLDNEKQRYEQQMNLYAEFWQSFRQDKTVRLGLYFPVLSGWRQWDYESEA